MRSHQVVGATLRGIFDILTLGMGLSRQQLQASLLREMEMDQEEQLCSYRPPSLVQTRQVHRGTQTRRAQAPCNQGHLSCQFLATPDG